MYGFPAGVILFGGRAGQEDEPSVAHQLNAIKFVGLLQVGVTGGLQNNFVECGII